jgi:hypothetical protein
MGCFLGKSGFDEYLIQVIAIQSVSLVKADAYEVIEKFPIRGFGRQLVSTIHKAIKKYLRFR